MVAGIVQEHNDRNRTFHEIRNDKEPVYLGPGLVRAEPHPDLFPGSESGKCRTFFKGLQPDPVSLGRLNWKPSTGKCWSVTGH